MFFIFICLFVGLLETCKGSKDNNDFSGLICRDGANSPVDWWYIYKPPAGVHDPSGHKFSLLTPDTNGRWVPAPMSILKDSVLTNTLKPDYKRTYKHPADRAVLIFDSRDGDTRTAARGVLMASEGVGFLLTHTVPGFPGNLNSKKLFPLEELKNGHLLGCLSLEYTALNKVARALKEISPNITYSYMPETLAHQLPNWDFDSTYKHTDSMRLRPSIYSLVTVNESIFNVDNPVSDDGEPLEAMLVARPAGVKSCIYSSFAARQLIMLNVYGQSRSSFLTTTCSEGFGVRNIDAISIKHEGPAGPGTGFVFYVPTSDTDATWFAVSSAAHWQHKGRGPTQYWVCTSLVDKEDVSGAGGMLLCLQNFDIWVAFDNLKVAEPSCD